MYKIGEFSVLAKTTIKALRYYEKEGLLIPSYIDKKNGYRFYETQQLLNLSRIISLRQIGLSIGDIKKVLNGNNLNEILMLQKAKIEDLISISKDQLSRINYLLEGKEMKYETIIKELPEHVVYYKEGKIKNFSELTSFILSSGEECRKLNPNIKCIEPDYCYVSYLDKEYKPNNINIRYSQAVNKIGVGNNSIKFEKLNPTKAACIYHKGSYSTIRETYSYIIKWVEENGYVITEPIRERYIDGIWNKEKEEDWLTEIQVPIAYN